jgi:lipopolysaccharide transport system ATP-binding protein
MTSQTINFENVSKMYHLGLTRTSLPGLLMQGARRLRAPRKSDHGNSKILWALKDVSFQLNQGESLALIGPNGAGKTTILKLLSNITVPTSGTIKTQGQLSALIELGAGFHPDLTGRENIFLNGTILGLKRKQINNKLDEIIGFSELERFIDTPVKRYSSGMIVRLGFAVAACIEPEILLVDEVLAVGDASFSLKCLSRISDLIQKGTSLIFVSHNLYLVQAVCQKALYLEHGQVQSFGKTRDVISDYERNLHESRKVDARPLEDHPDGGSNEILINKVEIVDESGRTQDSYPSIEPLKIRIHYSALLDIGKINVAAYLVRSDGLVCCMMRTKLSDYDLIVHQGRGIIELLLKPAQLISGTYFAEAYFLNAEDSMVFTSGFSDWSYVTSQGLSYEDRSGVFIPNYSWDHQVQ